MLDRPLEVKRGQPASDKTCKLRMEQRCWRPKSRICEHHRRKRALREIMVEIYPTPMSVMWIHLQSKQLEKGKLESLAFTNLSNVSSSSMFRSQAMYSSAASVIRGHHERSKARSFWRFSAISSTPSSVILLQPDSDNTVKCGNEWTARCQTRSSLKMKFRDKVRRIRKQIYVTKI